MPLLSYQYESSAVGSNAAVAAAAADFQELEKRLRAGAEIQFDVKSRVHIADQAAVRLAAPFSGEMQVTPGDFAAVVESDAGNERVFVNVDWAQMPATNDFYVRVFVNLPTADGNTPTDDPHYAGSFAFFGTHAEAHEGHGKTDFLVDATTTLQNLKASGDAPASSPLSVQLVPVPVGTDLAQPDAELLLNKIDLITTPVLVRD